MRKVFARFRYGPLQTLIPGQVLGYILRCFYLRPGAGDKTTDKGKEGYQKQHHPRSRYKDSSTENLLDTTLKQGRNKKLTPFTTLS